MTCHRHRIDITPDVCRTRQGLLLESCRGCTQEKPDADASLYPSVLRERKIAGSKRYAKDQRSRREFRLVMQSEGR